MNSENTPLSELRKFRKTLAINRLAELWDVALPGLDRSQIDLIISDFTQKGVSEAELEGVLKKAMSFTEAEKETLNGLVVERGVKAEQVHLFVQSTEAERKLLTEEWRTDLVAKLKRAAPHTPQAMGLATTTGLVGGSIGCLAFMTLTCMTQDAAFLEAGKALMGAIVNPDLGLNPQGFDIPNINRIAETGASVSMGATLSTLLLKSSHTVIAELFKADPRETLGKVRRDLEDRTMGVFSRNGQKPFPLVGNSSDQERALKALEDMPDSVLPILTHLQPKELVVFLEASDATRESMLRTNPPTIDQRIDSVRALHPTKLGRALATARQSLSAWEGPLSNQSTVSLNSSLATMRNERKARMGLKPPSLAPKQPSAGSFSP